jgi:hypothetical protein
MVEEEVHYEPSTESVSSSTKLKKGLPSQKRQIVADTLTKPTETKLNCVLVEVARGVWRCAVCLSTRVGAPQRYS